MKLDVASHFPGPHPGDSEAVDGDRGWEILFLFKQQFQVTRMLRDSEKLACSTAPTERRPCGNNMAIPIAPQNLTARKHSTPDFIPSLHVTDGETETQ